MATTVRTTKRMTADEFYNDPSVPRGAELVDGVVVLRGVVDDVTPFPPPVHGWIASNIYNALTAWVEPRRLGRVLGDGVPYQLGPKVVRGPDVSFISAQRLSSGPPRRGGWPFAPDLAVEVLSPSERYSEVRKKLAEYFGAGARQVWLVDPDDRSVWIHVPAAAARGVDEAGTVDGGDLLPGFATPVADVFAGVPREED